MMKNPRNLLIFGLIGGVIGLGVGFGLGKLTKSTNFDTAQAETDIRAMLDGQVAAWNSGDVTAYMDDYLQSDALRFASGGDITTCLLYTSPSPRDATLSRMPSSA